MKWDFFPHVDHSVNPEAFKWIMNKMLFHYSRLTKSLWSILVFNLLNQWQMMLMRFYRS